MGKKNPTIDTKSVVPDPMKMYTSMPLLNEVLLSKGKKYITMGVCWYVFRTYIRDFRTSGYLPLSEVVHVLFLYTGMSKAQIYAVLGLGEGLFWEKSLSKDGTKFIGIRSAPKVLASFNVLPSPGYVKRFPVKSYPIEALEGSAQERRAHLYKTTITKHKPTPEFQHPEDRPTQRSDYISHYNVVRTIRASSLPVSRDTIQERTGLKKQTQRDYEDVCRKRGDKVWTQYNWLLLKPLTTQEFQFIHGQDNSLTPEEKKQLWNEIYNLTDSECLGETFQCRTVGNVRGIFRQLPNSYADEARYVKNPLLVKYKGHSPRTKKKTLGKELAEVLSRKNPENQKGKSKFLPENILKFQRAQHQYLSYLPIRKIHRKKKKEIEEYMSKRHTEFFINEAPVRATGAYKREGLWRSSKLPTYFCSKPELHTKKSRMEVFDTYYLWDGYLRLCQRNTRKQRMEKFIKKWRAAMEEERKNSEKSDSPTDSEDSNSSINSSDSSGSSSSTGSTNSTNSGDFDNNNNSTSLEDITKPSSSD